MVLAPRESDRVAAQVDHARDPAGRELRLVDEVQVHVVIGEGRERHSVLAGDGAAAEHRVGAEQVSKGFGVV